MSEQTKRQAYVFLQDGDVIQEGDEYYNLGGEWLPCKNISQEMPASYGVVRRPITLPPEQTDGLTVWDEYAKEVFKYMIANGFTPAETAEDTINYTNAMMKARSMK
jgi:hypothetical protein